MKKLLPVLFILLGVAEIVLALCGIKPPLPAAILVGGLLIALGVKTVLDTAREKK